MRVADLEGANLDYWVARADESWKWAHRLFPMMTLDPTFAGIEIFEYSDGKKECLLLPNNPMRQEPQVFAPSTDWAHGGPIIERGGIGFWEGYDSASHGKVTVWEAADGSPVHAMEISGPMGRGPTPLIAAMRALVRIKFGKEVPDSAKDAPQVAG